jgi:hypothetical protein
MNPLLISALIAGAMGFGTAWTWQGYRMDSYKLEVANERIAIQQAARRSIDRATLAVTEAQTASKVRGDRLASDSGGAGSALGRLRESTDAAVRAASADLQACTRQVNALGVVFTESASAYRELAAEADAWSNQAVTLQSAWPSPNK